MEVHSMGSNTALRVDRLSTLRQDDFTFFSEKIKELAGITLKATKNDLLKTRIRSRLSELGLSSYREYREYLSSLPPEHEEWQKFINLLTTNKTGFFREPKHFEFIVSTFLPEWLKKDEKTLKIWSAACSSGEEAYTLAMVLNKHLPSDRSYKILATDIDTEVIKRGSNAVYPKEALHDIPQVYHSTSIDLGRGEASGWFRIKPQLKEKVVFKQHNLIEMTSPGPEVFDIILCRNVFIYFSPASIELVVRKLHYSAKPGGYLMIGHSESLQGIAHEWELVAPSTLRKGMR